MSGEVYWGRFPPALFLLWDLGIYKNFGKTKIIVYFCNRNVGFGNCRFDMFINIRITHNDELNEWDH
jgi:hypothetical protein